MDVKKVIKKPRTSNFKIRLTSFENGLNLRKNENLTPLNTAVNLYNFDHTSGALTEGLGMSDLVDVLYGAKASATKTNLESKSVINAYYSKKCDLETLTNKDKLALLFNDLTMAYIPLNESEVVNQNMLKPLNDFVFTSVPQSVNYRLNSEDVTIFTSLTDNMTVWPTTSGVYKVLDAPKIASSCIHYERMFATIDGEQTSVWFSDDLDPTNWSISLNDAGFIDMPDERGPSKKVLSFNDYVYVFRDYGIAKISAYSDQTTFNVSQLFVSSGKILPNTVVLCGDIIMFMATDGLYKFDGINCNKILENINPGFINKDNTNATAVFFENKYYLACNFAFKDSLQGESGAVNNCLIEVDLNTMRVNFLRGVDIKSLSAVNSSFFRGVIACAKKYGESKFKLGVVNHSGKIFGSATTKLWESPLTDLGYNQYSKTLREIILFSASDISFIVENELGQLKSFNINGSNRPTKILMQFNFSKLKIKIVSNQATCKILCPYCVIKFGEVIA